MEKEKIVWVTSPSKIWTGIFVLFLIVENNMNIYNLLGSYQINKEVSVIPRN